MVYILMIFKDQILRKKVKDVLSERTNLKPIFITKKKSEPFFFVIKIGLKLR